MKRLETEWELQAEILLRVLRSPDGDEARVEIQTDRKDVNFEDFMCATEFLLTTTAKMSGAGYERALELLQKGAMTYRDEK